MQTSLLIQFKCYLDRCMQGQSGWQIQGSVTYLFSPAKLNFILCDAVLHHTDIYKLLISFDCHEGIRFGERETIIYQDHVRDNFFSCPVQGYNAEAMAGNIDHGDVVELFND